MAFKKGCRMAALRSRCGRYHKPHSLPKSTSRVYQLSPVHSIKAAFSRVMVSKMEESLPYGLPGRSYFGSLKYVQEPARKVKSGAGFRCCHRSRVVKEPFWRTGLPSITKL